MRQAYTYYEDTEEFEQALAACEAALDLEPELAEAHNLRAIILEELDRPLEAWRAYEQALRLEPDFAEAKDNMAALKADFLAGENPVTIATFRFATEAYVAQAKLEAEGIWSFVAGADTILMTAGAGLRVRQQDVGPAVDILSRVEPPLSETDLEDIEAQPDRPPDEPD